MNFIRPFWGYYFYYYRLSSVGFDDKISTMGAPQKDTARQVAYILGYFAKNTEFPSLETVMRNTKPCYKPAAQRAMKEAKSHLRHLAVNGWFAAAYAAGRTKPIDLEMLMNKPIGDMTVGELKAYLCLDPLSVYFLDLVKNGFELETPDTGERKPMNQNELRRFIYRLRDVDENTPDIENVVHEAAIKARAKKFVIASD